MRILTAALLLLTVSAVALADGNDRQVVKGNVLKDLDYGFELKKPSSGWSFIKEGSIAKINPDAAAGLHNAAAKAFVLVVPEEAPDTKLEDYAELLMGTMDFEKTEVLSKKALTINGNEAYQYKMKCESHGIKLVYFTTIYKKGDFYFQVVCFWDDTARADDPKGVDKIFSSFTFTPGVKPRTRTPLRRDRMHGVGWRVEKDTYQNAVYGFAVKLPSEDWRFAGREELKEANPEASLGAEHGRSGAYVIVIAENLGAIDAADYEKLVLDSFKADNPARTYRESKTKLGGKEVTEHIFQEVALGKVMADFFLVTFVRGQVGYQIMSWCLGGKRQEAVREMKDFYSGFSWLEATEREKVRKELLELADCERSVTASESFRNRTYVNYEHGFSLALPQGFWSHLVGAPARAQNEDASFIFTNLDFEMDGTVLLEELEDINAAEFHTVMLSLLDSASVSRKQEAEEIIELLESDTDLDNLRKDDKFKEILSAAKGEKELPEEKPQQQEPAAKMTDDEREKAYEKALEHLGEGDADKALETYREILKSRPADLVANYWAACLLSLKKESGNALKHLERAVRTALATLKELKSLETKTVKSSSGLTILSTRFSEKEGNSEATYHLATATVGETHATVLFSGLKSNLANTEKMELEILKSIKLSSKLAEKTVRLEDGAYLDNRMGFKLVPPQAGFKVIDMSRIRPNMAALGTIVMMMSSKSPIPPVVIAGGIHTEIPDITAFVTEMLGSASTVEGFKLKTTSEETVTWLGHSAKFLKIDGEERGRARQVHFYATSVGGTFYFMLFYADIEGAKPEELRKCLELLP